MTLSVLEVISLLQAISSAIFLHLCFYFWIYFCCYVSLMCATNYLLTYLLIVTSGRLVYTVITCIGLQANAQGPGSCLHWIQSFWSRRQSPLKLENIYQTNTKFEYVQK